MASRQILLPAVLLMVSIVSCSPGIENTPPPKLEATLTPEIAGTPEIRFCAEETAREIEAFRRIQRGMSLSEVCKLVGQPDALGGSGMWAFGYRLDDGTLVKIGFVDFKTIFFVHRFAENAQGEWEMIEKIVPLP